MVPNAPLVLRLLAGIVLFVMAAQPAAAQPGTVSLSGRVTDAAGTGIPGVTLTVTGGPIPVLPVTTVRGAARSPSPDWRQPSTP